jgi:hypothetical protein
MPDRKRLYRKPGHRWKKNIKTGHEEIGCIYLSQAIKFGSIKGRGYLNQLNNYQLSKKDSPLWRWLRESIQAKIT